MNRYLGPIVIIIIGGILYGISIQIFKNGGFNSIFGLFKGVKISILGSYPTSSSGSVSPSHLNNNYNQSQSSNSGNDSLKSDIKPPTGFKIEQLSPYYGKVRINSIGRDYSGNVKVVNQISVQAGYSLQEGINISGWRIKANKGEITIPTGINFFNPSTSWQESDIIFGASNYVSIYNSASPLGRNLRLNKCVGYLNDLYKFKPELPSSCPSINRSEIVGFSGNCQNLILSFWSCDSPKDSDLNQPYVLGEPACRAFLDKLNYGRCFESSSGDRDFLSNEWRVWLNKNIPFDSEHDRLWLFDKQGLLVDEYVY